MNRRIQELTERYPILECNAANIYRAYEIIAQSYEGGGKLLIAGNGGSAADADHIVGELMKGFLSARRISGKLDAELNKVDRRVGRELAGKLQEALPAIALHNHGSLNTAFANDVDGQLCFAQQVMGYGNEGDVLLVISTSGNSSNIIYAAVTAKAKGLKVIGLTGMGGGKLANVADEVIAVEDDVTYRVQELHVPVYHCLCLMLEEHFWGGDPAHLMYKTGTDPSL